MRTKKRTHKHNSDDEDYKPADEQGVHESDEDDFQPRVKKRTKRRINVDRSISTQSTSTQSTSVPEGSTSTASTSSSDPYNIEERQSTKRRKISLSLNKRRKTDVIVNETISQTTKAIKEDDDEDENGDDDNVVKAISQNTDIASKDDDEIPDQRTVYDTIYRNVNDYVGSVDDEEREEWILDENRQQFEKKKILCIPAILKIVEEVLLDAMQNKKPKRHHILKLNIDYEEKEISIYNNGENNQPLVERYGTLPINVTQQNEKYWPAFCNMFCSEFMVETVNKDEGIGRTQVFKNLMQETLPLEEYQYKKHSSVTITFKLDKHTFSLSETDYKKYIDLFKKRCYDLSALIPQAVLYLNDSKIQVTNFIEYTQFYTSALVNPVFKDDNPIIFDGGYRKDEHWVIGIAASKGMFSHISFVNGIAMKDGTHVEHVSEKILASIYDDIQKKYEGGNLEIDQIKNCICLFIKCDLDKFTFNNPLREEMTLPKEQISPSYEPSKIFLKKIKESNLIDNIIKMLQFKNYSNFGQEEYMERFIDLPGFYDATMAGVRPYNKECTLIIVEGTNAISFAKTGIATFNNEIFGLFFLKDKLTNVRNSSPSGFKLAADLANVMKVMGLNFGTQYNDVNDIRYGRVLIITENNYQGALSKGLILSFFEKLFPSLLKIRNFIGDLTIPIKKCVNMYDGQEKLFYYNTDYEKWLKNVNKSIWSIKEIKNFNSLNEKDTRLIFGNIKRYHRKIDPPTENDAEFLDLVFSAHKIRERNEWIKNLNKEDHIIQRGPVNTITTFLKPILACYFIDNNLRAIPHLMDGCTTTQRRIANECFKEDKELGILELSNRVCHSTKLYHEANQYVGDICKMVQAHNINIINIFGKVDTDYYIFDDNIKYNDLYIRTSPLLRSIFLQEDDDLSPYCDNDNGVPEKKYFLPILPMILVNGCDSFGDGFVSVIPKFNPKDIAECIISMIDGNKPEELKPWFADFKGAIKKNETEEFYTTYGDAHFQDDTSIIISRLPYGQKTTDIIDHLKSLIPNENQYGIYIESYKCMNSDEYPICIQVSVNKENGEKIREKGLHDVFNLKSYIHFRKLFCVNNNDQIKRYDSPMAILKDFYDNRLTYYQERIATHQDSEGLLASNYWKMDLEAFIAEYNSFF